MATMRKVVGQITLKVIKDVESTTYFYLLLPSTAPVPTKPTTNPPPVFTTTDYDGWSETEPNYTSGDTRSLYVTVRTIYSDGSFEYTTPSLSSSYEAAKQAYNRAQSALSLANDTKQYFWNISSAIDSDIPAGAYVTAIPSSTFEQTKTGGNIIVQSTGITIRNGLQQLASLSGQALNFYQPINGYLTMSLSGNSLNFYNTNGALTSSFGDSISLGSNGAAITVGSTGSGKYNTYIDPQGLYLREGTTTHATLNSNGLILAKGGITAGEAESSKFIYLSTEDYPLREFVLTSDVAIDAEKQYYVIDNDSNKYVLVTQPVVENIGNYYEVKSTAQGIDINGHNPSQGINQNNDPAWRQVIGTNFGVDATGNLYATNANLAGTIEALEGKIGNWDITDTSIQTGDFGGVDTMYFGNSGISLDNTFRVTNNGELISTAGTIGGFTIGLTELYSGVFGADSYVWMGSGQYIETLDETPDINKTYYYLNNNQYIQFDKYIITSDETPQSDKTYYYIEDNEYKELEEGSSFEQGVIYYELNSFTQGITYYERRRISIADSDNNIDNWAFIAGQNFGVTQNGQLWSKEAYIQGDIEANNFKTTGNFQIFDETNLRMQLDEGALKFYSSDGQKLTASYGDDAIIGDPNNFHITITANYNQTGQGRLSFYRDATNEVAYISGDKLYIAQSVVLQQMDVGQPMVDDKGGQWSWKVHSNTSGQNNLYLKWIG